MENDREEREHQQIDDINAENNEAQELTEAFEETNLYQKLFTSDADIEEIVNNDRSVCITGYIDEVGEIKEVGFKSKCKLMKFVINNNGSKRIQILLWGDALIQKYRNQIRLRQIIFMERLSSKIVLGNLARIERAEGKFIPYELSILKQSKLIFLGRFNPDQNERIYNKSLISQVDNVERFIHVAASIKIRFATFTDGNNINYFCCTICDRSGYKIDVRIHQECDWIFDLQIGTTVEVYGIIMKNVFPMYIFVEDPSNIVINEKELMSLSEIRRSVKTPQRKIH